MNKPLKPGDLVYLLACPNSAHNALAGQVRTVQEPSPHHHNSWRLYPADYNGKRRMCWSTHRLLRLDPDNLKDNIPAQEELTA